MGYYTFSRYLKDRFGKKVMKISVDAGFGCPNRDGSIGKGGCAFCDVFSFSPSARSSLPLKEQVMKGIEKGRLKGYEKFFLYFQSFTNTYGDLEKLKSAYDVVYEFEDICAISIGTRPDCIDEGKLRLIESYADKLEVWLEYGLQSALDRTLRDINRGHTVEDFIKACGLTKKYNGIKICAHVILGLPGESFGDMLCAAELLSEIPVDGVKLHPLHIVKGTELARRYERGAIKLISKDDFIDIAARFIRKLPKDTVIFRVGADAPGSLLVAPEWIKDKICIIEEVKERLSG